MFMIGRKVQMTVVELGNKLREMSEIKNAKRTTHPMGHDTSDPALPLP